MVEKTKKKTTTKKPTKKPIKKSSRRSRMPAFLLPFVRFVQRLVRRVAARCKKFLARRPHRSFRLTRRRDYKRKLALPGYWSLTNSVRAILWKHWRLFGGLALVYIVVTIVIGGFGQQGAYSNLAQTLKDTSGDLFTGNFGSVGQASLLLLTSVTTGLSPNLTEAQSVLSGLTVFFGWLATVWLLRNILAGHKPRLRDGLYNSGSPVLATAIVSFIVTIQLLPAAIALIIYSAAAGSGLLESGVSAMLVWGSITLLSILSVYWISSSLLALVIVTLPGMYPMQAIRAAGDLVIGRRLRVLYRLAWVLLLVIVAWMVIMIPIIIFDDWVKDLLPAVSWLPIVPFSIIAMGSLTLIFTSSYIYMLYRRIVDDDAEPA